VRVVAGHGGNVRSNSTSQTVERTLLTTRSIEYDAVVVADGTAGTPVATDARTMVLLQEAFRHGKSITAVGDGAEVLRLARVDAEAPGVHVVTKAADAVTPVRDDLALHRAWPRLADLATAAVTGR
jgi:catalase